MYGGQFLDQTKRNFARSLFFTSLKNKLFSQLGNNKGCFRLVDRGGGWLKGRMYPRTSLEEKGDPGVGEGEDEDPEKERAPSNQLGLRSA